MSTYIFLNSKFRYYGQIIEVTFYYLHNCINGFVTNNFHSVLPWKNGTKIIVISFAFITINLAKTFIFTKESTDSIINCSQP